MRDNPILQSAIAGLFSFAITLIVALLAVPTRPDVWSMAAFGLAVAATFVALRIFYPPVVAVIAVVAMLASPQLFSAALDGSYFAQAPSPRNLLLIPEWHMVLAIFGAIASIRRRAIDRAGIWLLAIGLLGLLLPAPLQQAALAPLIGLGAGRALYRGTLTKPFRIPPAGWAMVLLTIAAVRSTVIMVTWAPKWGEYQNRIGMALLDREK